MGQRTQVVFQIENENKKRTNVAYHLQWGIGRITPSFIMQAVLRLSQRWHGDSIADELRKVNTGEAGLLTDESEYDGFGEELQTIDFSNIEQAKEWFSHQCNNNGGAVVRIFTKKDRWGNEEFASISVSFLKGGEDCEETERPFERFLTYEDWAKIPANIHFCDEEYGEIFAKVIAYFA